MSWGPSPQGRQRARTPTQPRRADTSSVPHYDNPRFVHEGKVLVHQGSVFDKLTDPSLYTGSSKHRFDAQGRGRGVEGRESHSLYGLTAAEAVREADSLPYGDDREARRWSAGLRAGLYSRMVDEQSRMRRAELLHEREVATRGRMWNWKGTPSDGVAPTFEYWQLDPVTGELRLDQVRTNQLMHGPANEYERRDAMAAYTPQWTEPVPISHLPPPESYHTLTASQKPMTGGGGSAHGPQRTPSYVPSSSTDAFNIRRAHVSDAGSVHHTPPPIARSDAMLRLEEGLPPRPLASWETRELAVAEGAVSNRSAASIPGALPAWTALRERTGLQSPPLAAPTTTAPVFSPQVSSGPALLAGTTPASRPAPQWIDDPRNHHYLRPPSVDELMAAVEAQSRFTY